MTTNEEIQPVKKSTRQTAKSRKSRESFGHLRQLPSGRFQASYVAPDGKRHNAPTTFDNKTDARAWLAGQLADITRGTWDATDINLMEAGKNGRSKIFGEYASEWLNTRTNVNGDFLRPTARLNYEKLLERPLAELCEMRIKAITPEVVRNWYAGQIATGKKTQAARAYGLLNTIMTTAVEEGLKVQNPCMIRGAQNAKTGRKVEPPTLEELDIIVEHLSEPYQSLVLWAAWGGMRFGELTELRRKDVTLDYLEDGTLDLVTVKVSRGVVRLPGNGFHVGAPKTAAGVRSVVMPPFLNDTIQDYLSKHVGTKADDLIFPARDGHNRHLNQSTVARQFYKARRAAKRDDLPFHGLRHFAGTRFAHTGATDREIMARLGHSSHRAAMRYQHTAGREAELAKRMKKI